jgi:predicted dehydrogenase
MNNRRQFLRTAAAATAAPFLLPGRVWSADPAPSSRITMGFVGMGKQSKHLLGAFLGQPGVQVVAVCDVDKNRRESAQKRVQETYSKKKPDGWKGCDAYNDFRELIARKDIDAVCIATPDHWHAIVTVAALNAGKDVYCEKPLTHNIHEAVTVIAAVKSNNRVLQTGSMQRSSGEFRTACELVQNGVIGKISRVECQFGGPPRPNDLAEEPSEPGLDWDRWLGPAPVKPYSSVLAPRGVHDHFPLWREYAEYGGGYVCDWGAHHLDIAQWGLGMDENGPVEVRPPAGTPELIAQKKNLKIEGCELVYASGIVVQHKQKGFGVHFFGENGEVKVNRGQFEVIVGGKTIAKKDEKGSVERAYMTADKELLKDAKIRLYKSTDHIADFVSCVRSRKKPITHEGIGGGTAIVCHLMNIAYKLGKPFKWDPVKHDFVDGSADPKFLTRDYRGEWKV